MFEDLPVLFVEDWSEINQELLDDTIEKLKNKDKRKYFLLVISIA